MANSHIRRRLSSATPLGERLETEFGTSVEVSNGVKDGDQVILNPPVDLTDGHKVNVRTAANA